MTLAQYLACPKIPQILFAQVFLKRDFPRARKGELNARIRHLSAPQCAEMVEFYLTSLPSPPLTMPRNNWEENVGKEQAVS